MKKNFENLLFYSLILLIPIQLGKHYWPDFAYVLGIRVDYLSPTIYLTDIFVFLLFISFLFRKLKPGPATKSKVKSQKSKIQLKIKKFPALVFIFFICYLLLVIFLSSRVLGGLYSLLKTLEMAFVAYYTAKFVVSKQALQKVIILLGVGVIAESILTIAQYFHQGSIGGLLYFLGERTFNASTPGIANASLNSGLVLRPYGTLPHPNVLAGYLVVAMTLLLFSLKLRLSGEESRVKSQELRSSSKIFSFLILNSCFLIQATAVAFGTIALFLTMSRLAIVVWMLILIIVIPAKAGIYLGKNSKLAGSRIKFGMTIFSVAVTLLLIFSPVGARFTQIKTSDESFSQRAALANESMDMIKANPLFGVGLGNFLPTLAKMQTPLMTSTYLQPVHSIFWLVAAETGLIGLGFFTWFLWKTMQRIKKQELRIKEMLMVLFSVVLITGLFDHYWLTLQQGQLLFALILGLCWRRNKSTTVNRRSV